MKLISSDDVSKQQHDKGSREVSIETVGWVIDDDKVHHISNVQTDDVLPGAGEL